MPLKCPLEAEGGQEAARVCTEAAGGWGLRGPASTTGRRGTGDSYGGITNAPVTFSVNEKGGANKRE